MKQQEVDDLCQEVLGSQSGWKAVIGRDGKFYILLDPPRDRRTLKYTLHGATISHPREEEIVAAERFVNRCAEQFNVHFRCEERPFIWKILQGNPNSVERKVDNAIRKGHNSYLAKIQEMRSLHGKPKVFASLEERGLKIGSLIEVRERSGGLPKGWQGYVVNITPEYLIEVSRWKDDHDHAVRLPPTQIKLL